MASFVNPCGSVETSRSGRVEKENSFTGEMGTDEKSYDTWRIHNPLVDYDIESSRTHKQQFCEATSCPGLFCAAKSAFGGPQPQYSFVKDVMSGEGTDRPNLQLKREKSKEVDDTESRRERFKTGQRTKSSFPLTVLGSRNEGLSLAPTASHNNLSGEERRLKYSVAHDSKRFQSTSNVLIPLDSPRYSRPVHTNARRTFRRRSVHDIFSTLQGKCSTNTTPYVSVTFTIKLSSGDMSTVTAPREAQISDLVQEFCASKGLPINNFEIVPVKDFFDSFTEEAEKQTSDLSSGPNSSISTKSLPMPATTITVTTIEVEGAPTQSAPSAPSSRRGSNALAPPSDDQITLDNVTDIGDLVSMGYTTIMLQEKKTTAKRKLLKKTDRISTGLSEKMTIDSHAETLEVKEIEAKIEREVSTKGKVGFSFFFENDFV